jgi:predicted phosphodiesterase
VPEEFTRILSDLHYGERSSRVHDLSQLRPLFGEPAAVVVNGDALDTRPGPDPTFTARCREEVQEFFAAACPRTTFVTGNHDPDISAHHHLDLAGGRVFVTHGDVLFDDVVPWGRDAAVLRARIKEALDALPPEEQGSLEARLLAFRRVAGSTLQRHQVERSGFRYVFKLAGDSVWPPWRMLRVLVAWRRLPGRGAALVRRHRPDAGFCLLGHTHRAGVWRAQGGAVVINTGALCYPFRALAVDVSASRLVVRRIVPRSGEFRIGEMVADFKLG